MSTIEYRIGNRLDLSQVIELYTLSTLGERRPTANRERMAAMLAHANLVVSAWHSARLVGLARTLTDFTYVGYLADLAVHADYQRRGIGTGLIARSRRDAGNGRAAFPLVVATHPAAAAGSRRPDGLTAPWAVRPVLQNRGWPS
ncbi:MAG: GNAT family N-acetyltransferase, partial [Verrucomicrobia bacterium]|nr:GNAT family N-acetyltransferase [Verrucomicrobiota bacterium]